MNKRRSVVYRVLLSIDKFFNWFKGDPEMSISASAGENRRDGDEGAAALCEVLDVIDEDHCAESYAREDGRLTPQEATAKIIADAMPKRRS
jgi:hypothetical protein